MSSLGREVRRGSSIRSRNQLWNMGTSFRGRYLDQYWCITIYRQTIGISGEGPIVAQYPWLDIVNRVICSLMSRVSNLLGLINWVGICKYRRLNRNGSIDHCRLVVVASWCREDCRSWPPVAVYRSCRRFGRLSWPHG